MSKIISNKTLTLRLKQRIKTRTKIKNRYAMRTGVYCEISGNGAK